MPRSGSFVPIRHSRYYTTLLTPKMYLRNTHLVSFTKQGRRFICPIHCGRLWIFSSRTLSQRPIVVTIWFTHVNGYLNKVWYLHIYTHTYLRAMPTTQRTNTYTTRSDRQFDLWRIIILCSLAYILLPASIILCPERISAFFNNSLRMKVWKPSIRTNEDRRSNVSRCHFNTQDANYVRGYLRTKT